MHEKDVLPHLALVEVDGVLTRLYRWVVILTNDRLSRDFMMCLMVLLISNRHRQREVVWKVVGVPNLGRLCMRECSLSTFDVNGILSLECIIECKSMNIPLSLSLFNE